MANKLLPEISLTAAIEDFASKELHKLTKLVPSKRQKTDKGSQPAPETQDAPADPSQQDRMETSDNAVTRIASKRQREENAAHKEELESDEATVSKRQRTSEPESLDAKADSRQANGHAALGSLRFPGQRIANKRPQSLVRSNSFPTRELRGYGAGAAPDRFEKAVNDAGRPPDADSKGLDKSETPETAARHCELYCALCTKHHVLLRDLFVVFGECKGLGRAAVMRNAEGLARVLGASAPALLALIDNTPEGSTNLLLRMLNFLTETQFPPQVSCFFSFSQHAVRRKKSPNTACVMVELRCLCSFSTICIDLDKSVTLKAESSLKKSLGTRG